MTTKACDQCPWRRANQGKRHRFGFYTKANLRRLWNQLRGGGRPQSCHMTDPSHPDHVSVGAKPGATARECAGSVIVIKRELRKLADKDSVIGADREHLQTYLKHSRRNGLTRNGLLYWVVTRIGMARVAIMNPDGPLPDVDNDPEIGLPPSWESR